MPNKTDISLSESDFIRSISKLSPNINEEV